MEIEIGCERIDPNHSFSVNLRTGNSKDSAMASGRPYLSHPPLEGDVIGVEIDQGMMSILINSVSQGVAFEHPDL